MLCKSRQEKSGLKSERFRVVYVIFHFIKFYSQRPYTYSMKFLKEKPPNSPPTNLHLPDYFPVQSKFITRRHLKRNKSKTLTVSKKCLTSVQSKFITRRYLKRNKSKMLTVSKKCLTEATSYALRALLRQSLI